MTTPRKEPVSRTSADPNAERVAQLRALFPDAFADGKLDVEKLRAAIGENVAAGPERFTFSWAGRSDAAACLQTPTRATLVPVPKESVNFDTTKNLFIEGDNLEVLKLLYKPYHGRVKLIYIDPPYNTGQDFIYPDDFKDTLANYLALSGQADAAGNLLRSNPDTSGRYHSDWLSMMYPRLFLARQLLRDDGVIFISIDDHEVHHLRMLMNEVFGEENFLATCVWQKRYSRENRGIIGDVHDYIVIYAKSISDFGRVSNKLPPSEESKSVYRNPNNDPNGPWRSIPMSAQGTRPNQMYVITAPGGKPHPPPSGRCWSMIESEFLKLKDQGRIWFGIDGNGQPNVIRYLSEIEGFVPWTWWPHEEVGHTDEAKKEVHAFFGKEEAFDTPKPVRLIKRMLQIGTYFDQDELILDFFSGSGTTAQAVLELNREDGGNRRFILVQLPEPTGNKTLPTIAEIGKERIRRVIDKLNKETGNLTRTTPEDLGFKVFKLADSNFVGWTGIEERTPEAYEKQMRFIADEPLKKNWTEANVLWEVAIKEGYGLNSTFETVKTAGATIHKVTDPEKDPPQHFLACLGDSVPADIAKQLNLTVDDLFVVRDAALDDTLASNLALQCRLKTL